MELALPRPIRTTLAAALIPALAAGAKRADAQTTEAPPYALAFSSVHRLGSPAVGDTFEVSISLPFGYEESGRRYPVVITLDADFAFAATAQISRLMQFRQELPEFVLVGVGYGDFGVALAKRARDLTPTVDEDNARCTSPTACGGAAAFADFIDSELVPFVAERYRIDRMDRTLVGNSLGGLFGCWVLLERPGLFGRYVLGSPTVSWDHDWAITAARDLTADGAAGPVFVGVGGEEGAGVEGVRAFVDTMRQSGATLDFRVFEGERHMSAQPAIVFRGLRVVFGMAEPGGASPRSR